MNVLVCIPTYNEAENIELFIKTVFEIKIAFDNCPQDVHALVIDDNSPDGTAELVDGLMERYPQKLHILKRPEKQGLGKAYIAAFEWGFSRGYDVFLEMDADFSHNPEYIPQMLNEIQSNDVVIGSRNVKGGGVEGWGFIRNVISKGGSLYSRMILGCPVKDLTGGFNMWTKETLQKIGLQNIISKGYSFQVEMKYRAFCAGCRIKEIPILFVDRKLGKSKMSKKIFFEALLNVVKIKQTVRKTAGFTGISQFLKFCVTGGLGTITNILLFFVLADMARLGEIPVSVFCFIVAGTQNYIINQTWSFKTRASEQTLSFKRWLTFLCASLFGLAVNIAIMKAIITHFVLPYKFIAQAVGIAGGMVVNFIASKYAVFKRTK